MRNLVILLLAGCAAWAQQPQGSERDKDVASVQQTLQSLAEAELRYDLRAVNKMLDQEFIYVGNDGSLTSRKEFLSDTSPARNRLDILEVTDVEVHLSGQTAVATGLIHEKGSVDGQSYEFRGRTLTTFVKKDGAWYCLAMHD